MTAIMLLSLTACAETETERIVDLSYSEAFSIYADAINSVWEAGSFAGHISLFGLFSMMGMERRNELAIGIRHVFGNEDDFHAEIDASWTPSEFIAHFKDGVFYFNSYYERFRLDMPGYLFLRMTLSMLVTEILFSEDYIFGLEVIEDSYGTAMRFEVRQSGMQDVLRQLADFEDTGGATLFEEDDISYEFEDVVIGVRIDPDGELRDIRLAFVYLARHHHIDETAVVSAYLEIGMSISQVGGVIIDFPNDLHSFPDFM